MRLKFPYACFFNVYIVRVIADIWQNNRKHLRHYFETWNINFHCHFIYVKWLRVKAYNQVQMRAQVHVWNFPSYHISSISEISWVQSSVFCRIINIRRIIYAWKLLAFSVFLSFYQFPITEYSSTISKSYMYAGHNMDEKKNSIKH